VFFFGEITGERSAEVKSSRNGKTPKEKLVGKLISGCVHLIENISNNL
jgi:hypothetical protein